MQVCREKWKTQPLRRSSTPPRTSPLRVAVNGPPGSSLLRMVLPSSSSVVVDDRHRPEPSLPPLPAGRPVPPFKPPGLFARTSGLLAAAAAAAASATFSAVVEAVSNGDDLDDFDDEDDEFDDDDDDEEEWDDEYDVEYDEDAGATAAGELQVTMVSYCRKSFKCTGDRKLSG